MASYRLGYSTEFPEAGGSFQRSLWYSRQDEYAKAGAKILPILKIELTELDDADTMKSPRNGKI